MPATEYTVGILTVSDTASKDVSHDKSGPLLKQILVDQQQYIVKEQCIIPDEIPLIQSTIQKWSDNDNLAVILVTGGTGFAERDVTPEAVKPLLTKETPGITHLILSSSIDITPFAALSRPVTGIRNKTIIITLPGSPKACKENMETAVLKILPHALDLLSNDRSGAIKKVHQGMQQVEGDNGTSNSIQHHTCIHKHDIEGHDSQTGTSASLDTPVSRRARSSPYPLISIVKACHTVAEHANVLNVISVPVSQFLTGYILAQDVKAFEPVPGYRASVVDGYAVYVEDGPGIYPIESISLAKSSDSSTIKALSKGKLARVATGGIVPDGANAVVMVEDTVLIKTSPEGNEELEVEVLTKTTLGENIRNIGSDCAIGELIGTKGQCVSSDLMGVFASVGVRHVKVYRKPRVGVLSSGNEVMDHIHTDELKPGQIRDTNRLTLLAAIQQAGFEAVDLGIVDDDVDEIVERLEEAVVKVDVLITTGGVSMGEADFMKPILEQKLEATIHFGRVLMKPGKPTTFATIPQGKKRPSKLVFALPGNPVSANVGFHVFVLPALRKMAGWAKPENPLFPVKIKDTIRLDSRPEFHRVTVSISEEGLIAKSTGKQQSSRMLSMVEANGLLQLPGSSPQAKEIQSGETVPCILIGTLNSQ